MIKNCKNCKHFLKTLTWGGECRRLPPIYVKELETGMFPKVVDYTSYYCSEFKLSIIKLIKGINEQRT